MFVTQVTCAKGGDRFRTDTDQATAEKYWAVLIDRACDAAEDDALVVVAAMYEVDADTPEAAREAIRSSSARKVKSVTIRPPKSIRHKVTEGGPGLVTEAALARAQKIIETRSTDYLGWARADLAALKDALKRAALEDIDHRAALDHIFHISYRMKGQGGTFGYQMITVIADRLCKLSAEVERLGPRVIEAIRVHVDALTLILAQEMSGSGGAVGQKLVAGLDDVVERILGEKS